MNIKSYYILFLMAGVLFSCGSSTNPDDANIIESSSKANNPTGKGKGAIISFEHDTWDFGTMTDGEQVEHEFPFTNTGDKALLISDVQVSCGCTTPGWPREPILPGQAGIIKLGFNSTGKSEKIEKHVTIYSNSTPIKKELHFTAYVKKKPEAK
ncbi:MAG: DUF1573 domain-containing protein [Bacteroidia bacterium]